MFDCPPGSAVAVGGDEMILVDSGARTINLGGPGAVEITMKGGMTIDATDADGVVRPISMSNLHVTGDASLGAVGTDTLTINAAVTATSDFAILPADPTAGEPHARMLTTFLEIWVAFSHRRLRLCCVQWCVWAPTRCSSGTCVWRAPPPSAPASRSDTDPARPYDSATFPICSLADDLSQTASLLADIRRQRHGGV